MIKQTDKLKVVSKLFFKDIIWKISKRRKLNRKKKKRKAKLERKLTLRT